MRLYIECKDIDEKHIEFLRNEMAIDLEDFITLKLRHKRLLLYTPKSEDNPYYHFTNAEPTCAVWTHYYDNSDALVERIKQLKLLRLLQ